MLAIESLAQALALCARHHIEKKPVCFARVVEREDVWVLKPGSGPDLGEEPLCAYGSRKLWAKDLESDLAAMPEIVGQVHCGHPAFTELTLDAVAARKGGV
jgi:hypothetical protein